MRCLFACLLLSLSAVGQINNGGGGGLPSGCTTSGNSLGTCQPTSDVVPLTLLDHAAGTSDLLDLGTGTLAKVDSTGAITATQFISSGSDPVLNLPSNATHSFSSGDVVNVSGQIEFNNGSATHKIASAEFGSCTMAAATTCTFSVGAAFVSTPLSFVSLDGTATPPATAVSAKCSVSGTTATVTAGASNSLKWDCMLVGNPT